MSAILPNRHQATIAYPVEAGRAHPLGATPDTDRVNFSVFSQHAIAIDLLLFSECSSSDPIQVIPLDPKIHKTFHFWHIYVRGLKPGMHYAYRVDGP